MLRSRALAQPHPGPVWPLRLPAAGAAGTAGGGGADRRGDLEAVRAAGGRGRAVRRHRAGADAAGPLLPAPLRGDLPARQGAVPPARRLQHRRDEPAAAHPDVYPAGAGGRADRHRAHRALVLGAAPDPELGQAVVKHLHRGGDGPVRPGRRPEARRRADDRPGLDRRRREASEPVPGRGPPGAHAEDPGPHARAAR